MHKRFSQILIKLVNSVKLFFSSSLYFVSFTKIFLHSYQNLKVWPIYSTTVLDVGLVGCNSIGIETFNFYSSIKWAWQPRSCSFLFNSGITMKLEEQLEEKYKHQSNVQPLFDALYLSFLSSIPNIIGLKS